MKSLTKLLPKGFQRIIGSHRHADTRQLLSLFMFLPATRIKRRKLKTLVIENYTYLQNKRMRRCGVPPPPIIFERLKLPQQIIYRRKENLSESPNLQKFGKIFWFRDFISNFREIGGI